MPRWRRRDDEFVPSRAGAHECEQASFVEPFVLRARSAVLLLCESLVASAIDDARTHARTHARKHVHTRARTQRRTQHTKSTPRSRLGSGSATRLNSLSYYRAHSNPAATFRLPIALPRFHFRKSTGGGARSLKRSPFPESDTDRWPEYHRRSTRILAGVLRFPALSLTHSLTLLLFLFLLSARDLWPLIRRRSFYHTRRCARKRTHAARTTRAHDVHKARSNEPHSPRRKTLADR